MSLSPTALLSYHIPHPLSTLFLTFFIFFTLLFLVAVCADPTFAQPPTYILYFIFRNYTPCPFCTYLLHLFYLFFDIALFRGFGRYMALFYLIILKNRVKIESGSPCPTYISHHFAQSKKQNIILVILKKIYINIKNSGIVIFTS